jgi:hypothetical protein
MKQLVKNYIWGDFMRILPLHGEKFVYQADRYKESALNNIFMRNENAVVYKKIAFGTFLDVMQAFDKTSFAVITEVAKRYGVEPTTVRWIHTVLQSRSITDPLSGKTLEMSSTGACRQGTCYCLC